MKERTTKARIMPAVTPTRGMMASRLGMATARATANPTAFLTAKMGKAKKLEETSDENEARPVGVLQEEGVVGEAVRELAENGRPEHLGASLLPGQGVGGMEGRELR